MDRKTLKKIVFIKVLLTLTACTTMPPKAPDHQMKGDFGYVKEYMTWFVRKEMKAHEIVGLSIALVDDQAIVWQQGFGYADLKNKIASTPQTIYRAGSISKLFNAMATMKLVEAGKMDIDRPLSTYLPAFRIKSRFGNTDGITPRTIMTHHSGLPGDWIDGMWTKQPEPFTRLVHAIKDEYVAYAPNTVLSYSNLGVTLLGHAVQNVSGREYAQFMDQNLLKPMGMKDSRFETGISGNAIAHSYVNNKEVIEYPLRDLPAGGLNTTVSDLARLAMLINNHGKLQGREILSPGSINAMFTAQNSSIPLDFDSTIGLAWFIDNNLLSDKEPVYWHSGGVIAHRAMFMVAPESKLGAVVLANSITADSQKIAKKLLQMAWEAKNGVKLPGAKKVFVNKPSDFKGTFTTMIGKVDVTEKSKDRYKVRSSAGNFNLNLEEDHRYRLKYRLLGFIPIDLEELGEVGLTTEDVAGHHVIIAELDNNRFLAGVRVAPHPIHESWKNRLGHYVLLNPPEPEIFQLKDFELKIEGDYLVAIKTYSNGALTQILRTMNADEALIDGLGRGSGETIRIFNDDEKGEILTHAGLRFRLQDAEQ